MMFIAVEGIIMWTYTIECYLLSVANVSNQYSSQYLTITLLPSASCRA